MVMLMYIHAGLMGLGFCIFLCGVIIARYIKKRIWWLKTHRILGIIGVFCVILAFFAVTLQITLTDGPHFGVPHSYVGIVVVILSVVTPIFGLLQFKLREAAASIKKLHIWSGRMTIFLMLINILFGLWLIGVIY